MSRLQEMSQAYFTTPSTDVLTILDDLYSLRESKADIAQLVEQLIRNQQVAGSTPAVGSTYAKRTIL